MTILDWSTPIRPRMKGAPRDARSYRAARRNRVIRGLHRMWVGVKATSFQVPRSVRLRRDGTPYSRYTPAKLRQLRRTRR